MHPSSLENPNDSLTPLPFIPLVRKCTEKPSFLVRENTSLIYLKVRQMAAFALVPLIPTNELAKYLRECISALPNEKGMLKVHVLKSFF